MKKLVFLLPVIFPGLLFAQTDNTFAPETNNKLHVKFGVGIMQYNLSSFNNIAQANNFPTLKDGVMPQITVGFILNDCIERFVFDANISMSLFSGERTNAYRLNMNASNFDFNANYKLFNQNNHLLLPSLGLGFMGYSLDYTSNRGSTFGQALQTPNFELKANTRMGVYLNPRVTYEYTFSNNHHITIGIQSGYRIGINKPIWRLNRNQVLTGAPRSDISGFYSTVYLSF